MWSAPSFAYFCRLRPDNLCVVSTNSDRLQQYLAAEAKILGGQSVRMGDRELRRADLKEIRDEIRRLQRAVAAEESAASGRGPFARADFGGEW